MSRRGSGRALRMLLAAGTVRAAAGTWDWAAGTPASQGMSAPALEQAWGELKARGTTGFLVIRNDCIVLERYAEGLERYLIELVMKAVNP